MGQFTDLYPDMQPGTDEAFKANDPNIRHYSTTHFFLKHYKLQKSGENERQRFRAMPNPKHKHYAMPVPVHKINDGAISWVCSSFKGLHTCPACKASKAANAAGNKELARSYNVSERYLIMGIDRKKPEAGVMVLDLPQEAAKSLANMVVDAETGLKKQIDHLDDGYDFIFTRRKNQGGFLIPTDFAVSHQPMSIAGDQPIQTAKDWVNEVLNFPLIDQLVFMDDKKVRELMELPEFNDTEEPSDPDIEALVARQQQTPTKQADMFDGFGTPAQSTTPVVSSKSISDADFGIPVQTPASTQVAVAAQIPQMPAASVAPPAQVTQPVQPPATMAEAIGTQDVPSMEDLQRQMAEMGI